MANNNEEVVNVYMLQNILHYTGDYISKKYSPLSHSKYPTQNDNVVGKLLFVPYRNENGVSLNYRLYIPKTMYRHFEGISGPYDNFTKVLRFDMEEPYVAILVDEEDYIIVGDSRVMLNYKLYPNYKYTEDYRGFSEAHLDTMTKTWDEFNEAYNQERLLDIHVQNQTYLGYPVYVEYFNDLLDDDFRENILPPDKIDYAGTKRFNSSYLNKPFRASERGYVIRADESGTEAEIVVMCIDEETGKRKYLLGSEAYFYIKFTDTPVKIGDLNLWQTVLRNP